MSDEKIVTAETEKQPPATDADKSAADATVTATEPEKEPTRPPEGYVPHQALHQERMTRRRLERDLAEERIK